tara:strand:+ start:195 stop:368 length:174 start_codon:yes stop_codon:yes gene_type:complete
MFDLVELSVGNISESKFDFSVFEGASIVFIFVEIKDGNIINPGDLTSPFIATLIGLY